MAAKQSAGILLYRKALDEVEVFLVHPGGPFWRNKDSNAWSIPKGEFVDGEEPQAPAVREFYEETGNMVAGKFTELKPVKLKSGKMIFAWAVQSDLNERTLKSNLFEMEWPPSSGNFQTFPEVDKGAWFAVSTAKEKINAGQLDFISQIEKMLEVGSNEG
ncbi:MAG: NUDIX domain-containing protein [Ginsengibacter sp.]